ncbi:MAG: hypothetical protein GY856_03765 [bacterium]|nr:hypothetical protein [bacterium]
MTDPSRRPATEAPAEEANRRLGGMSTVQFIADLHGRDVELWADDGRLRFSAPKGALTPELRDELVKRKSEVLRFLSQTTVATGAGAPLLEPVPRTTALPLSFAQERMWFFDRYEPQSSAYNMSTVWRLRGTVQVAALWGALVEIVRRHEVLRTTFADAEGRPLQVIAPRLFPELPAIDLGRLPASVRGRSALELARWIARRPFDLSRGPLLRLALVRLSADEHLFVFAIHHIVADGASADRDEVGSPGLRDLHLGLDRAAQRVDGLSPRDRQPYPVDAGGLRPARGRGSAPENALQLRRLGVGVLLAPHRRCAAGGGPSRRRSGRRLPGPGGGGGGGDDAPLGAVDAPGVPGPAPRGLRSPDRRAAPAGDRERRGASLRPSGTLLRAPGGRASQPLRTHRGRGRRDLVEV